MANINKLIGRALKDDGAIGKKELKSLKAAGITSKDIETFMSQQEVVGQVGNKFGGKDFKRLEAAGVNSNDILKIAASTNKVTGKANNKLTQLNPGISVPSKDAVDGNYGGSLDSFSRFAGGMQAIGALSKAGKSLKDLPKNYYQWQGINADGSPLAIGGYKVPKKLRKGDPLTIAQKAMGRSTFGEYEASGTLFGRDGNTILNNKGEMKNNPTTWTPGKRNTRSSGRGNRSGGGGGVGMPTGGFGGSLGGGDTEPTTPASSTTEKGSGVFGGAGTETFGSPAFRRRRSRAQRSGSFTQGPSRLGINLQRQSGLNIMRA